MDILWKYVMVLAAAKMSLQKCRSSLGVVPQKYRKIGQNLRKNVILIFSGFISIKVSALFSFWLGFIWKT